MAKTSKKGNKIVHVHAYKKKDGTKIAAHRRSTPNK